MLHIVRICPDFFEKDGIQAVLGVQLFLGGYYDIYSFCGWNG